LSTKNFAIDKYGVVVIVVEDEITEVIDCWISFGFLHICIFLNTEQFFLSGAFQLQLVQVTAIYAPLLVVKC